MAKSVPSLWKIAAAPALAVACLAAWAASSPAFAMDSGWITRDQQILQLQATVDRMRGQDRAGGWPAIAAGPALRMGATDPRLPALRRRLGMAADESQFDLALHRAVRAFQLSHGLPADGVVGEQTRAALNVPLATRLAEIESNLARWRQQPDAPAGRYILVNIAFMELHAVNTGQVDFATRVIVGKPTSQTPMFEAAVRGIDFSPYWNIPARIAQAEILPRARRDPAYLARNQIEPTPDRPGQWRQRPGPHNALGLIRFDLPNRYNVYLHDTPEKRLFEQPLRMFSHGCVRVQDPARLAAWLLEPAGTWTADAVQSAMADGISRRIDLPAPVPVRFVYFTVWANAEGVVEFRPDLYGLNASTIVRYASDHTAGSCAAK